MLTLILPGFSPRNKDWAVVVSEKLNIDGVVRPIFWDHWEDESKTLNPEAKAELLAGVVASQKVNIIAKSVGTLVAAYLVKLVRPQVEKVILCGIPSVSEERAEIFKNSFGELDPSMILCIQNSEDPLVNFTEAKDFVEKINSKIKVIEKDRNDHHYPHYEEFQGFITS